MLVGLGEGVAPSAAQAILARIVPATERSRAVTMFYGGMDVGSVIGLVLSGPLIKAFGWPSVFYLYGVIGLLWAALWPSVKAQEAVDQSIKAAQEAAAAANGGVKKDEKLNVPWKALLTSKPVIALTITHFCQVSYAWVVRLSESG